MCAEYTVSADFNNEAPSAQNSRAAVRVLTLRRMSNTAATNRAFGLLFARLVLGLIFFMAGVFKVFQLGPVGHTERFFLPYRDTFLPVWSLWATGMSIPFIELIAGGLLLVGLRIRESLIALGAVLVVVTFGHLLSEPLYPFHEHVIPRLALAVFLLAMPPQADRFSLDALLRSGHARTV